MVDLQPKGEFNGGQQGGSEMSALQMPVYWIFLEKFQFLSVPFSPFLSDATHILYLKTNKEKGQGAQGRSETSAQGTSSHFLILCKKPHQTQHKKTQTKPQTNTPPKQTIEEKPTPTYQKPTAALSPAFSGFEENNLFCSLLHLIASADLPS